MEQTYPRGLLRVRALYFTDERAKPLRGCIAAFAGGFLVVAADENDTAPTWYNGSQIARMEGVERMTPAQRQRSALL